MSTMVLDRRQWRRLVVVVPLLAGAAWMMGMFLGTQEIEDLRAGIVLAVLIFLSLAIFRLTALGDLEGDALFWALLVSFGLKISAVFFRFAAGLLADAFVYNLDGVRFAELLAAGVWPVETRFSGSYVMRLLTGMVYLVTGPTIVGISILWAWLGLIGMLLFYKAFIMAFPQGNRRLYMILVLLFPSMLLWTSSLGKDAPMMLAGGMAAYGAARLRRGLDVLSILCLLLGVGGMLALRGHLAAIFSVALALSLIVRPVRPDSMAPFLKVVGLICVVIAAVGIAVVASRLVGLGGLDVEEVQTFISERQGFTGQTRRILGEGERGASAFKPIDTSSPLGLAMLIPTVLIRPFPWEAHNSNAMISAVESLGLLALIVYRRRSVTAAILGSPRSSFLLLSVLYALMFIYIFSAVTNFGIIARQRVQVFPYVFMWIAYLGARRPGAEVSSTMTAAAGSR